MPVIKQRSARLMLPELDRFRARPSLLLDLINGAAFLSQTVESLEKNRIAGKSVSVFLAPMSIFLLDNEGSGCLTRLLTHRRSNT